MEGRIVQKLECRPYADNTYYKLKSESIRKASMPQRQVQQLDRIVQNFKPVSDHKHNVSIYVLSCFEVITVIHEKKFNISICNRLNIKRGRRLKERRLVMTKMQCSICYLLHLRNTSITILRIYKR